MPVSRDDVAGRRQPPLVSLVELVVLGCVVDLHAAVVLEGVAGVVPGRGRPCGCGAFAWWWVCPQRGAASGGVRRCGATWCGVVLGCVTGCGWGVVDGGLWLRDCVWVSVIGSSLLRAPSWRDRLRASGVDFVVMGGWAGLLAGGSAVCRAVGCDYGRVFRDPASVDLAQFVALVRVAGLVVVGVGGGPPAPSRIAVRTAVKLLPWQIAHLSVTRAAGIVPGRRMAAWSGAGLVSALGLAAVSSVLAVLRPDGRALHDLVAGTRVAVAADGTQRFLQASGESGGSVDVQQPVAGSVQPDVG